MVNLPALSCGKAKMSSTLKLKSLHEEIDIFIDFFKLLNMSSSFYWSSFECYYYILSSILIRASMFSFIISVCTYKEFNGFLISWETVEFISTIYCFSIDKLSRNIFFEMSINCTIYSGSFIMSSSGRSNPIELFFNDMILSWKKQNKGWFELDLSLNIYWEWVSSSLFL